MNTDFLIQGVLRSVLGGRRRRSGRALRYLTRGGSGFLSNPQTLLTAAGMAWGLYETMQAQAAPAPPALGGDSGVATGSTVPTMPPLPAVGPAAVPSPASAAAEPLDGPTRVVRLAVAAAYADGALTDEERAAIIAQARAAGVGELVEKELEERRRLADVVRGVSDPAERATLYGLAFTIIRADEQVSGADRIFLAQLATHLGLDPATTTRLEDEAARRIDSADEPGLPPPPSRD